MKYLIAAMLLFLGTVAHAYPDGERTVISKSNMAWGFLIEGHEYPWVCGRAVEDMSVVYCISHGVAYQCVYHDPSEYFNDCVKEEDIPVNAIIPAE